MRSRIRGVLLAFIVILILTLLGSSPVLAQEECFTCHGEAGFKTIIDGKEVSLYVDHDRYADQAHGKTACTGCHIGFGPGPHGDEAMGTYRQVALGSCEKCHSGPFNRWTKGSHKKAKRGPRCIDCHDNHFTQRFQDSESAISYLKAPEEVCGKCHHEALELYVEGYHGKTLVVLGYAKSASCAKCHDAHEAKPLETPDERIVACRQCHPAANENFVGYVVHANENDRTAEPMLFWVKWIMSALLVGVLGFFYGHTFLWAYRDMVERRKKRGEGH